MSGACPRRGALRLLGGGVAAGLGAACAPRAATRAMVRVSLSGLAGGRRVVVALGDDTVELSRSSDGLVARSLVCTHQGCVVAWQEATGNYKCPCQGGFFDAAGRPLAGPVSKPLPLRSVRIEGDDAIVGG